MKKIVVVAIVLGLTGCNAAMVNQSRKMIGTKLYQDSTAEHTANLRVEHANNFSVTLYPNGCITSLQPRFSLLTEVESMGSFQDRLLSKPIKYKEKRLGMPFPPPAPSTFAEYKVPANQLLALSASFGTHNGAAYIGCSANASYKFAADKNYEVFFNLNANSCLLKVHEIMPNGEKQELKAAKNLNHFNEWAGCEAQLKDLD